jgi:hypothetical protein
VAWEFVRGFDRFPNEFSVVRQIAVAPSSFVLKNALRPSSSDLRGYHACKPDSLKGFDMTKKPYETPILRQHGKVEALTKGGADGAFTDAFFPANTPKGEITFS